MTFLRGGGERRKKKVYINYYGNPIVRGMTTGNPNKDDNSIKLYLRSPSGGRTIRSNFASLPAFLSLQIIYIHWKGHFSNMKIALLFQTITNIIKLLIIIEAVSNSLSLLVLHFKPSFFFFFLKNCNIGDECFLLSHL